MLSPPTDRLHKFLAIAGIMLITVGFTYPLQKYHDSEIKRIEAFEKVQIFTFAYNRYAEKVNEGIAIYNKSINKELTSKQRMLSKIRIEELLPETMKLDREVQDILVPMQTHTALAKHYYFMKNVWFSVGLFCVLVGIFLSYIGFKEWLSQSKIER